MDEYQELEKAIAELEAQRGVLSDDVIDAALTSMREKLAALEAPEQQRKLATILFADVVSSTNIVKHLDPEDVLEIMDGSLKRLAEPVEEHGGHVARFMGDGFKAVFGMPKAHENDPEMAIRAGLGILETAQELGGELNTQWGIQDFQVRVGINTGLAALGGMTEAEDTVMGSTVNLTKRVESAAPPGRLLITHNTYCHVRGIFNVEPRKPIKAKGFDEPIQVYIVLGIKPRAFRVPTRGVEGVETRMVGRKTELIALQEAFRNAIEGVQTQVVTVVGEAGVGKSRLLHEFQNWLELLPDVTRFFQGRGRQETQNLPYALLKDLFTFRFQIQESDKTIEVHNKIEASIGEVLGEDEEGQMRAHIIGQLLGFDYSESQHVKTILDDPQQIHDRALMYLAEYFQGMSKQAPVVILLEDIHWADDSSLDMLNRLARRIPEQRVLFVCVARHRLYERRPHWGEGLAYHRRLELQPLTKYNSSQLVTEILQKVDQIPDSLQDMVVKGAEGNPFYIEELIKMLVEDGVILTGEEQWQVKPERLTEIDVPDTLTGVLQTRLEGLPQEERSTLQQASVVGHIFWNDTVEYITNESTSRDSQSVQCSTDENLSSLRSRELIYHREESAFTDAAEYTFKHAILRDVTYESVLKRLRKAYHGLVAEWLIQHSGERAGEYTGLIADHLDLAGKDEQAAIYLYQAGEEAAKRYANDEAVQYYCRALDLTPEDDLVGRYDLLLAREKVLNIIGDRDAQQADLAALEEIAKVMDDAGKQTQATLCRIIFLQETGDYSAIQELAKNGIDLAKAAYNLEWETNIYLQWGRTLWLQAKYNTAQPILEQALVMAREYKFEWLEAEILRNLGAVLFGLSDLYRAKLLYEQALNKCRLIGDKRGEAGAINNLGNCYVSSEWDYLGALEYYKRGLQINRDIGFKFGEALVLGNIGETQMSLYDYFEAIDWYSQSLKIYCEIDNHLGVCHTNKMLKWIYYYLGKYENALDYLNRQMDLANQFDLRDEEIAGLAVASRYYSSLGDFNRAESFSKRWEVLWNEIEDQLRGAWSIILISRFNLHKGNHQAVKDYCRQCVGIFIERNQPDGEIDRLLLLGDAISGLGEQEEAEEVYQQAIILGYEIHQARQVLEAQAGLTYVYMARGENEMALTQVDEILSYMEENTPPRGSSHPLDGAEEPFRILLTCYQVLKANDDPRAEPILIDAYNLLNTRATNIGDEHLRDCFLNNVAVNREIVAEYKALGLEGGAAL